MAQLSLQLQKIADGIRDIKVVRNSRYGEKLERPNELNYVEQIDRLQNMVSILEPQFEGFVNRLRRPNLIIYGVPRHNKETDETLYQQVNKTF